MSLRGILRTSSPQFVAHSRVTYESQGGSGGSTERGVNGILKHFFFLTESAECMWKCKAFYETIKKIESLSFTSVYR